MNTYAQLNTRSEVTNSAINVVIASNRAQFLNSYYEMMDRVSARARFSNHYYGDEQVEARADKAQQDALVEYICVVIDAKYRVMEYEAAQPVTRNVFDRIARWMVGLK